MWREGVVSFCVPGVAFPCVTCLDTAVTPNGNQFLVVFGLWCSCLVTGSKATHSIRIRWRETLVGKRRVVPIAHREEIGFEKARIIALFKTYHKIFN